MYAVDAFRPSPRRAIASPGWEGGIFIGRHAERGWLQGRLDALADGRGGLAIVSGDPGMGKTTLVREATREWNPLWARTWEFGDAPALWPIVQLVRALARRQPEVFADAEDLLQPVLDPRAGPAQVPPMMLYSAVIDAVRAASEAAPVLLVIDDLHAADRSTLELLSLAGDGWQGAPVLLLATRRTSDTRTSPDVDRLLARLAQDADERVLTGLPRDDAATLVAERLGRSPTESELAHVLARAGGSPLFIEGLVAAGHAEGAPLPRDLAQTLVDRLDALPDATAELLRRASLSRERFTEARLAHVLGWSSVEVSRALHPALTEGLLTRDGTCLQWTHQLYAEASASTLSAADEREGHLAWLAALDGPDSPHLAACAEHALAAGDPSAAERLIAAGEAAGARGGFATAADLFQRAMLHFDEPGPRMRAQLARAWALHHASDTAGAKEAAQSALRLARQPAATPARAVPEVACAMADMVHFGLQDRQVADALREALEVANPDDHAVQARILCRFVIQWAGVTPEKVEGYAQRAARAAERSGDPEVVYEALLASVRIWRADRLAIRTRAVRALESLAPRLDAERQFEIARWAFNTALENCHGQWARIALSRMERLADELQTPRTAFVVLLRQATLLQLEGHFDRIDADAIAVAGRRAADPNHALFGPACTVLAAIEANDRDLVQALAPTIYDHVVSWPQFPAVVLQRALIALHAGHDAEVDAVYLPWRERRFVEEPWWGIVQGLATCAAIAMARDDREAAEWILAEMAAHPEGYAGTGPLAPLGPLAVHEARLRRWLGKDASEAEARARRLCERLGAPLWLAKLEEDATSTAPVTPTLLASRVVGMRRAGDVWCFVHDGAEVRLRDKKGFEYLAELVGRSGTAVHVLELTSGPRKDEVDSDAGPMLDAQSRQAYAERAQDLYAELAEAEAYNDLGRVETLTMEIDALTEELARATGLGGRDRRVASNAERARSAVKQALRRALKSLRKELPEVADHLDRSLETGALCRYDPAPHGLRVQLTRSRR